MDPNWVSVPPLYLYVGNFAENTTPGDLWELLFSNNAKGADYLDMIEKGTPKSHAIVRFKNAKLASDAVPLLINQKFLDGKKIAVSTFVHAQHTIANRGLYEQFIRNLRDLFARRKDGTLEYIDAGKVGKSAPTNPVLGEQQGGKQPKRWIHIKLFPKKGSKESTTLVMRDDNLYVKGFTGENGKWFELCEDIETEQEKLPKEHYDNPTQLTSWGFRYDNLMKLNDNQQVIDTLKNMKLGKDFAERAVLRLSRYCPDDGVDNNKDDIPVRVGLAGLILMICESARFEPLLNHFSGRDCWNQGRGLPMRKDLGDLIWNWKNLSAALLKWRDNHGKVHWNEQCGADTLVDAIKYVQLVLKAGKIVLHGRTHVEILGISANLDVGDINVIDQHNKPHNIYAKKQGHDANKELEQNVGDTSKGTEGCEWIDVKVKLPNHSGAGNHMVIEKRWDYCHGLATNQLVKDTIGLASSESIHHRLTELELIVSDTTKVKIASGRESFVMKFNLPHPGVEAIERRFDCRREEDGHGTELVNRTIGLDNTGHKIVVTYLVMSNFEEANVLVRLRGKPGNYLWGKGGSKYTAYGKITAQIMGFEHHPIVLLRKAKEEAIPIEWNRKGMFLQLDRSVVQVPRDKGLQIDMKGLHVTRSSRHKRKNKPEGFKVRELQVNNMPIRFHFGGSGRPVFSNDIISEVQVNVYWESQAQNKQSEPAHAAQVLDFDMNDFVGSIEKLRSTVTGTEYLFTEDYTSPELSNINYTKDSHPVLARPRANQPRWIHIKLEAAGEEKSSTMIAVRDDNCCGFGFMNQSGVWYDLGNRLGKHALPAAQYNSVLLDWRASSKDTLSVAKDWDDAVSYKDLLSAKDWNDAVSKLETANLGKDFAEKAVRTLWRYPDVEEGDNPRLALAGLMVMVCESAKLNTLHRYFKHTCEGKGTGARSFSEQRLMDDIRNWGDISRALIYWRDHGYCTWPKYLPQETMEIISGGADKALGIVHLVFNWQDQIYMEYNVEDKEGFTDFIVELRKKLADHVDREDLLDRRQDLPPAFASTSPNDHPVLARHRAGQPARWFHVKLNATEVKVNAMEMTEETVSTTLVIRDDNLLVVGFMNQIGTWYELQQSNGDLILPAEYNSVPRDWITRIDQNSGPADLLKEYSWDTVFPAEQAVRYLSRYPQDESDYFAMRGLSGLTIMVCESARLNSICDVFARGSINDMFPHGNHYKYWKWDNMEALEFIREQVHLIKNWDLMSYSLLSWKDDHYFLDSSRTTQNLKNTLKAVHLVLNRHPPPMLYSSFDY